MDELIKLLDENLLYESHKIDGDTIYIYVQSTEKECTCPECSNKSEKIHSWYTRTIQDLPIQGKKSILVLRNRKFFCHNPNCTRITFSEKYSFFRYKAKKTKRLESEIIDIAKNVSSVAASKFLRKNIANVGKSTVCDLLKKDHRNL